MSLTSKKTQDRFFVLYSSRVADKIGGIVQGLQFGDPTKFNIEKIERENVDFLTDHDKYNTVLLVVQHNEDDDLWRKVVNDAKSRDPYVELILLNLEGSARVSNILHEPVDALNSGYYAYFEHPYQHSVLKGYIRAASDRIERRKRRYESSAELNKKADNLGIAAKAILEQLGKLVEYDQATVSLISERGYIFDRETKIRRSVRTLLHQSYGKENINWWLLRPVKDDRVIEAVLTRELKRRVFPNAREDLDLEKYGWEKDRTPQINSWIVLPLRYLDNIVGVITLDALGDNYFSYADISEITIRQFANQAALTILSAQRTEINSLLKIALSAIAEQTEQESILETIAHEACKLVDGLFSYVVLPNKEETHLEFKSAAPTSILYPLRERVDFPIANSEKEIEDGQGITVLAYLRGKTVLLDDCHGKYRASNQNEEAALSSYDLTAQRAYMRFDPDGHGVKTGSNIAIPILDYIEKTVSGRPRVLGVINIEHENPSGFTEAQIDALEEFAGFAAIAIKTNNAKQRIHRLFEASNTAMSAITQDGEVDVIDRLANETENVAGADGGVKIFTNIDGRPVLRSFSKSANVTDETREARSDGHTRKLFEVASVDNSCNKIGSRIIIPDVSEHDIDNYYGIVINPDTTKAGHNALVCLPMCLNEQVMGAMWLHFKKMQQFTETELKELQLYANRAAIGLRNEMERKLLEISEKIGQPRSDPRTIAQEIVDFVKNQFKVKGVIFYANDTYRRRLSLYASTIDSKDDDGKPIHHMPIGKIVKYGQGLAGHHFVAKDKDHIKYSQKTVHKDYNELPLNHQIEEDAKTGKLHSIYSIRLEAPLTGEKIGILILNDQTGRTYKSSEKDLQRFAELSANLLALIHLVRPNWVVRIGSIILFVLGIFLLVGVTQIAPVIFGDQQLSVQVRILAFLVGVIAGAVLTLLGINGLR